MATETIIKCDICGKTHSSAQGFQHWTNKIEKVVLSFKDHSSIQSVAFEGDACADCARGLHNMIRNYVKTRAESPQGSGEAVAEPVPTLAPGMEGPEMAHDPYHPGYTEAAPQGQEESK